MSQGKAAELLGINQPKVSALSKYRLEGFSVERLMLEKWLSPVTSWKWILPDFGKCCVHVAESGLEPSTSSRHTHCRPVACGAQEALPGAIASSARRGPPARGRCS